MEQGLPVEHVAVSKANLTQLTQFAELMMGLEVPEGAKKDDIKVLIETAGWTKDTIPTLKKSSEIPAVSDSNGKPRPREFMHEFGGKERKCVAIVIPEQEKPGGAEPVPVSCNGVQLYIPRNEPHAIPVEYVEILENAEKFVYPPIMPDTSMQEMETGLREPRVVKEYPFSYAA
ncbi:hypothetical protein [Phaeobacter gallaeciensis]|uniref:hypothetical protein n=1 Tax=Phaeobacter gallaeciensis TaxID=60890 RepID=UPI00237FC049|nr:hypothetical protein [Phaeobacter gallaeciensis]MDE4189669.1 hypothetical protein [Phaeobacter gallaeciensis]MDE4198821.1 hypothetical protein [Phaeobacter gallaeciensis]MDE4202969.1 hypothetical protein [Phaeobacter gallaeciensis]MDE4207111.1 hypothetical protein [Phaeobacter gallaeciensis]MDE4215665.1 hypothetical protein [Phaeobacter gallaeciensis]